MAEQKKDSKMRRFFRVFFQVLLALLAMAAVFVAAVLLKTPGGSMGESYVVVEEPVPVTRMQSASMNDPKGLAQLFGAPLPALPGYAVSGEGGNTTHDGKPARVAVLYYEGLTITAVQPASAAPLLLHDELDVALVADLTVLGLPAALAQKGDAYCMYFSTATAAYSVYAAHAEKEDFYAALGRLSWAQ